MSAVYNRIAGQSLERLAALSDGIFAVAMTLLVLDLHLTPPTGPDSTVQNLLDAMGNEVWPHFVPYIMSFLTLGIFWVGQQTQLSHFARSNRNLAWLHLWFLLMVTLMPFSTGLLAEYLRYPLGAGRLALVVYWLNIALLGFALFVSWRYAWRAELVKDDTTTEVRSATERRILIAQSLYAFGALLCIVHTYLSVAFIVLVQLNYVIAPRIRPLYHL